VLAAQQVADEQFDAKVARPAYQAGGPRVLFDEAHYNFHTASGRYAPFARLIANDGYRVTPNKDRFTKEVLARGDVLVIANALGAAKMGAPEAARSAFTAAECDAVLEWVKAGGRLLLIADHTPMGGAAGELAKRFGVGMSNAYTQDPKNNDPDGGSQSFLLFTRANKLLQAHPITEGRDAGEKVNKVVTFTGQSLKGPEGSVAFLRLADTAFDVDPATKKQTPAPGRAQGLALQVGKGRVVVLGEAACLSAQLVGAKRRPVGMNVPGLDNRRLALNVMHGLSGLLEPEDGGRRPAGPGPAASLTPPGANLH
jgi:hypothetical protein